MLELLASDYRIFVQNLLAITLIVIALIWGGGPERAVAATWLIFFEFASRINQALGGASHRLTEVDLYLASMDVLAGVSWIAIAIFANRNYTLWIAGMQILAITAHLARGIVESISPVAYITMVIAPGWFQLFFMAIGLGRHLHRKKKYGTYRDWRMHVPPRLEPIIGRGW